MKQSSENSSWLSFNLFDVNLLFKVHKNISFFFIYVFFAVLGLRYYMGFPLVAGSGS